MKALTIIALTLGILTITCAMMTFPLMWLWNSTLPELFGFPVINAWMAFKLSLLAGLLFQPWSSEK